MRVVLIVINIIISILIVGLILMQGRGAGLGSAWGGGGETFQTRRGIEKVTLNITIFCIILFFIISVVSFLSNNAWIPLVAIFGIITGSSLSLPRSILNLSFECTHLNHLHYKHHYHLSVSHQSPHSTKYHHWYGRFLYG